jgi:preprotein translocase SecE subunit
VARSTRQQRKQRRAQQRPALAGGPPARPPVRPVANGDQEPRQPRPERRDEVRTGTPGIRFFQESWGELKKVEWPTQQALISGTAVVIIACLITGFYLWANDQLWQYVVEHVFLR